MSCDEGVPVGWLRALCVERSNMHPFRAHPVPWVIVLGQSLCCLPTKRYLCGWSETFPSRLLSGGALEDPKVTRAVHLGRAVHQRCGTRVA